MGIVITASQHSDSFFYVLCQVAWFGDPMLIYHSSSVAKRDYYIICVIYLAVVFFLDYASCQLSVLFYLLLALRGYSRLGVCL